MFILNGLPPLFPPGIVPALWQGADALGVELQRDPALNQRLQQDGFFGSGNPFGFDPNNVQQWFSDENTANRQDMYNQLHGLATGDPALDGIISAARGMFSISSNPFFNLGQRTAAAALCKAGISMAESKISQVTAAGGDTTKLQAARFVLATLHGLAEASNEFWGKAAKDYVKYISEFKDLGTSNS